MNLNEKLGVFAHSINKLTNEQASNPDRQRLPSTPRAYHDALTGVNYKNEGAFHKKMAMHHWTQALGHKYNATLPHTSKAEAKKSIDKAVFYHNLAQAHEDFGNTFKKKVVAK